MKVIVLKFRTLYTILFLPDFCFLCISFTKNWWNCKQCRPWSDWEQTVPSLILVGNVFIYHFVRNGGVCKFRTLTILSLNVCKNYWIGSKQCRARSGTPFCRISHWIWVYTVRSGLSVPLLGVIIVLTCKQKLFLFAFDTASDTAFSHTFISPRTFVASPWQGYFY